LPVHARQPKLALVPFIVALAVLGGPAAPAGAVGTTLVDAGDTTADAGGCGTADNPCNTIQAGVDAAAAGDTVAVAAGTYPEAVTVDHTVVLRGAQSGNDARARDGSSGESIVTAPTSPFTVSADNVVIDGFTVRDGDRGVTLDKDHAGYQILNDVVRDNGVGVQVDASGASQSIVRHNAFMDNNKSGITPPPHSGEAIRADAGSGNVLVDENAFSGHQSAAMDFASPSSTAITVSENQLTGDNSIALVNVDGATISGNTSTGSLGSVVFIEGNDRDVQVTGNTIVGGSASAVRIADTLGNSPSEGVSVVGNTISGNAAGITQADGAYTGHLAVHFNDITGNTAPAVANADADGGDAVDAENNWWGCNAGPSGIGCDGTSGGVDPAPWLLFTLSASPASVFRGGHVAALIAAVRSNSEGDTFAHPPFPPSSVAFATDRGSVPTPSTTVAGAATALLRSGRSPGVAHPTARLDSETATTSVKFTTPPWVSISSSRVGVTRSGRLGVRVRCLQSAFSCRGTLTLAARVVNHTTRIAERRFSVGPRRTASFTVTIEGRARMRARSRHGLRARVTADGRDADGYLRASSRSVALHR
jgi:hypothetical protein